MALQLVHLRKMFDASTPPNHIPPSDVVAFYIGGDTPHVWTDAQIKAVPDRWRLPIWVRSNPNGSGEGTAEGEKVVKWLESHHVPKGCAAALDLETAIDNGYVHAFDSVLVNAGYVTAAYGSTSTLFHNGKPSGGYWAAAPPVSRQSNTNSMADGTFPSWQIRCICGNPMRPFRCPILRMSRQIRTPLPRLSRLPLPSPL